MRGDGAAGGVRRRLARAGGLTAIRPRVEASGVPEAGDHPSFPAGTAAGAGRATSHATPMLSQ